MPPITRPAVRVLLLDESSRLLLFRHEGVFQTGDVSGTSLWAPPGGGVEAGESHEEAATRELCEETGLSNAQIGPCIWLRDVVFTWDGIEYDSRERYYVCHVPAFAVDTSGLLPRERVEMTSHHWWTLAEVEAAHDEVFVPRDLAGLLPAVLRGEYPNEPLQLGI